MEATRFSTISESRKLSREARESTRTTFTPSAANMHAYSQPITPAPRMVIVAGRFSRSRISSLSWMRASLKSIPAGRAGREPVAMRNTEPPTRRVPPSPSETSTTCASTKRATPRRQVTPWRSRLSRMRFDSEATIAALRDMSRGSVAVASSSTATPYISRERYPERYIAVSRSVLLGTVPVRAPAPPGSASRSIATTRLPKYAACAAAFSPAGPTPITTRSQESTGKTLALRPAAAIEGGRETPHVVLAHINLGGHSQQQPLAVRHRHRLDALLVPERARERQRVLARCRPALRQHERAHRGAERHRPYRLHADSGKRAGGRLEDAPVMVAHRRRVEALVESDRRGHAEPGRVIARADPVEGARKSHLDEVADDRRARRCRDPRRRVQERARPRREEPLVRVRHVPVGLERLEVEYHLPHRVRPIDQHEGAATPQHRDDAVERQHQRRGRGDVVDDREPHAGRESALEGRDDPVGVRGQRQLHHQGSRAGLRATRPDQQAHGVVGVVRDEDAVAGREVDRIERRLDAERRILDEGHVLFARAHEGREPRCRRAQGARALVGHDALPEQHVGLRFHPRADARLLGQHALGARAEGAVVEEGALGAKLEQRPQGAAERLAGLAHQAKAGFSSAWAKAASTSMPSMMSATITSRWSRISAGRLARCARKWSCIAFSASGSFTFLLRLSEGSTSLAYDSISVLLPAVSRVLPTRFSACEIQKPAHELTVDLPDS